MKEKRKLKEDSGNAFNETPYSVCRQSTEICSYKRNKHICLNVQGDLSNGQ